MDRQTAGPCSESRKFFAHAPVLLILELVQDLDELERYLALPALPSTLISAHQWWLEPSQWRVYPNFSHMAIELPSIPAMSAELERLFSGAKLTITDQRASLQGKTIEVIECLKSWFCVDEN